MLGFVGMFFSITSYATTNYDSRHNYSRRLNNKKPTFENNYVKLLEQTKKIFEYGLDETNVKSSNFIIFHKNNDNTSARSIIFASNKKSENSYFYNVSNKPEVTDFYNVLIEQKFYKELNDLSEHNRITTNFKPYLIHEDIFIEDVEFLFNRNMVLFLNMLFFKSQKKEEELKEKNASRFDTVKIKELLKEFIVVNVSGIYLERNCNKFVFYVQFDDGISTCYASGLEINTFCVLSKLAKINDMKGWTINVEHTRKSRTVAMAILIFGGVVGVISLIVGGIKWKKSSRKFNSEEERIGRERYMDEISGINNTRTNTPEENRNLV